MNSEQGMTPRQLSQLKRKMSVRFTLIPLGGSTLLLLSAGSFAYWQVYLYFAIVCIPMLIAALYFLGKNPRFLQRRYQTQDMEKPKKSLSALSTLFYIAGYILPGLDQRFQWSQMSIIPVLAANALLLLAYLFIIRVYMENSHASRVVEITENQDVIRSGPYRLVRHPMYLGMLVIYLATPFALASFWAVIPFLIRPLFLIMKLHREEKALSELLPGYQDYCRITQYRLIPFIW